MKKTTKAKKPQLNTMQFDEVIILSQKFLAEATEYHFSILIALRDKIKELDFKSLDRVADIKILRCRLALLEKAELDRQAHEVTK
jgi:hypothetical protein